ncbi:MAG: DUF502 domain-containing protein [Mariprofundaceae bacterium]|nr:DUF502 domain-containing protein [Mariprofundaceae bacterium]
MIGALRRYLMAGLAVSLPILVTFIVIRWLVGLADGALALLPPRLQPDTLFGVHIPGVGVALALIVLILIGALTTNILGKHLMRWLDAMFARVPVVRPIYGALRQLMDAVLGKGSKAFRQVVLISFPQKNQWTIGFVTGETSLPVPGEGSKVAVFVPTTPNPTSGWLLFVSESELVPLAISVEDGMKVVVSGGMLGPKTDLPINGETSS